MSKITAFNVEYPTIKALAEAFGKDPHLVRCRINRYDWSPEKAVLTDKHGSFHKGYSDHKFLLKHAALFKSWQFFQQHKKKVKNNIERLKEIVKGLKKLSQKLLKDLVTTSHGKAPKGHGRYSIGRLQKLEELATSIGSIYLALVPSSASGYYLKIGISKYLNASQRKKSLPNGTMMLYSQHSELHRCFQAEQSILALLKKKELVVLADDHFEGYTEVLCHLPKKYGSTFKYELAIKDVLKKTLSYKDFQKLK